MKKILIVFAFICCNACFAQPFSCVKIYITNPYVNRAGVIRSQMYNMDYVRSHYATYMFSMEENYINSLYDSLMSLPLTRVAHDSVFLLIPSYWGSGTIDMDFEPCIVIDFIRKNRFNTNDEVWTFSMNRQGYVCRTFPPEGNLLCYPNKKCLDFLERQYPGLFFLIQ